MLHNGDGSHYLRNNTWLKFQISKISEENGIDTRTYENYLKRKYRIASLYIL